MNAHANIYPNAPGHRGVSTSMEAADALAPKLGPLQKTVLDAVRNAGARGLTTNELADRLRIDRGTAQPRTSELKRLGLIRDSQVRRPNSNGKRAIVWVAANRSEVRHG
jgi:predicted transcriptional regulator